jgi:hypothetical protein
MDKNIELVHLVELVEEIASEDPIDWALLSVDEKTATYLIANNLLEQYTTVWQTMPEYDRNLIMLATITKLVVENFTLNLRIQSENKI